MAVSLLALNPFFRRHRSAVLARLRATQLDASDLAVLDDPLLIGDLGDKGLVLGDGDDGALEVLERLGQRGHRIVVEVVGRLVKRDHVRLGPEGGADDETLPLPTAHLADLAKGERLVDTEVGQVLEHLGLGDGADGHARLERLGLLVVVFDQLEHVGREAHRDLAERQALRVRLHLAALLELVPRLVALGGAADNGINGVGPLHGGLLLVGQLDRLKLGDLGVEALTEARLDVLDGRAGHVILQVVERLLRDVREAERVVLPRGADALLGLQVADEQLQKRRLARAVAADDNGTRAEGERRLNLVQDVAVRLWVLERDVLERHHRLSEGADAFGLARIGEIHRQDEAGGDHLVNLREGGLQPPLALAGSVRVDRDGGHRLGQPVDARLNLAHL
mmetsp:Transcript_16542/g.35110  ORF Transcript_16542/g.35110 Transcript_16542/m.35110 type:complete len:394 (-) Transcript_16542:300-1481(-)